MRKIFLFAAWLCFFSLPVMAQYKSKQPLWSFLNFSLGVKGGVNFTSPTIKQEFSVFSSVGENPSLQEKEYASLRQNAQTHFGMMIDYRLGNLFEIGVHPGFLTNELGFSNTYTWEAAEGRFTAEYEHKYKILYLEIPLNLRYLITGKRLKTYVQGGMYYNQRRNAWLATTYHFTDASIDGEQELSIAPSEIATPGSFIKWHYGFSFGGGLMYNISGTYLGIEANYRRSLMNPVSASKRFSNQDVIGATYTTADDIRLSNLQINFIIVIPMLCEARAERK